MEKYQANGQPHGRRGGLYHPCKPEVVVHLDLELPKLETEGSPKLSRQVSTLKPVMTRSQNDNTRLFHVVRVGIYDALYNANLT